MAVAGIANEDRAKRALSLVGISRKRKFTSISIIDWTTTTAVCIARALANKPKLILADEPTGSLDPENASRSMELLKSLCDQNGCALIVVSHDPNIISCFEHSVKWEDLNRAGELEMKLNSKFGLVFGKKGSRQHFASLSLPFPLLLLVGFCSVR